MREIRRHLLKADEIYECSLVRRSANCVVLRYVSDRSYSLAGMRLPRGAVTTAYYWPRRRYCMWEIRRAGGELLGHLFHLCRDLNIRGDCVEYADMLLDLWVPASGESKMLDADDLRAAVRARRISSAEARELTQAIRTLAARASRIVRGAGVPAGLRR